MVYLMGFGLMAFFILEKLPGKFYPNNIEIKYYFVRILFRNVAPSLIR